MRLLRSVVFGLGVCAMATFGAAARANENHPAVTPPSSITAIQTSGAEEAPIAAPSSDASTDSPPVDFDFYKPSFVPTRIDTSEAPTIDGALNEAVWSRAAVVDTFYQVEPVEGAPPGQETHAYILYDERNLYVGIYAYDTEPELIRRALLARDGPLRDDDGVRIIIDSFGTGRDGYFFATNANGMRNDALVENNNTFRNQWNTIWNVSAKVVEDGWIAEFQIPFQSISFDASLEDWGFQIIRTVRRTNEEIRWSNVDQTRGRIDLTNTGNMSGIKDITSGVGLEAQLFVTGSTSYDWEADSIDGDLRPSGNIFYKITPSLTGSLTFLPDFSDAPLDARQVNTGRFSLFFPETRDFFLQDAAVFEFGGQIYRNNSNGLPFFSRNIGIVDDQPTDILAGAKISGKAGPASVGVISALTDSVGSVDEQVLSAARVSIPVLAESKAGFVLTHGDPLGEAVNTVAGADFQYRNTTKWPGVLTVDAAYLRSIDDPNDPLLNGEAVSDDMISFRAAYRSQRWNWTANGREIGEDYRPRLGFSNRQGIRRYRTNGWRTYRPQDSYIRQAETGAFVVAVTDLDDEVLDRFWGGWIFAENNDGDEFFANTEFGFLDIREPFDLAGEVRVDAGEYTSREHRVELSSTRARPFGVRGEFAWGRVFDGNTRQLSLGFSLRPNRHLSIGADYNYNEFDLPNGDIGIHVIALDTTVAFTPWMSMATDIQYDNISQNFTFFSRFSWEPRPENEIFVSLGHSAIIDRERVPGSFRAQGTSLALRLGHTLRF
ncbi:MAG: carbohydrate binding family 9 domain-containing protein [Pseudomonadota bacterium]